MKDQKSVAEKIADITERDIKKGLGQGLGVVVSQGMVDKIANLLGEVALDAHEEGEKSALRATDSDTACVYIYREGGWLLGWYIPTARGFHAVVPDGLAVQPLGEYQTRAEAEKAIRAVDRKHQE